MTIEPEVTSSRGPLFQKGTFVRALVMFGLLALVVLLVALLWPDHRPITEVERHLRRGYTAGAEGLRQDLVRLSPPGTDSGPAVQHLINIGFTCAAPTSASGEWNCAHRRPDTSRRVVIVEVRVRLSDGSTGEITTRIWDEPLR